MPNIGLTPNNCFFRCLKSQRIVSDVRQYQPTTNTQTIPLQQHELNRTTQTYTHTYTHNTTYETKTRHHTHTHQSFPLTPDAPPSNPTSSVALGLGLPPSFFAERFRGSPTQLYRIFNYPDHKAATPDTARLASGAVLPPEDLWGVREHSDMGCLTILLQDDAGGLEVQDPRHYDGGCGWVSASVWRAACGACLIVEGCEDRMACCSA